MSELREVLEEMVSGHLPDQSHFVVEVKISLKGDQTLLSILLDADQGVTIDTCARISRAVSNEIEEKNLIESAYRIEVSSPGVDYPLSSERQYIKNIGRELKVLLQNGLEIKGKLLAVAEGKITLLVKKKEKGKKATEEETSHALEDIKKSIVQVSFK
ncbi:ribosome maturation factor RimP [Algoriphagus sp.]|uniref:ribosome maturation factor RimP n=1 Tax=Algoriphagus sp. TaxID=1872435 RepID=UPI002611D6ED|nr:ribosome maturation factor RimP [Algoriphagus sp.]